MTVEDRAKYAKMSKVIKAMSHPTRLFIVEKLKDGKQCVQDLTEMIQSDISTVSRHLTQLKKAGIVYDERIKNNVYYSLRIPCISNFYACVNDIIEIRENDNM